MTMPHQGRKPPQDVRRDNVAPEETMRHLPCAVLVASQAPRSTTSTRRLRASGVCNGLGRVARLRPCLRPRAARVAHRTSRPLYLDLGYPAAWLRRTPAAFGGSVGRRR